MDVREDFKKWKHKKEKQEEKEERYRKLITETIKVKKIIKLLGDGGYHMTGRVMRHSFSAGCEAGTWFKGWNIGILKGVEFGKEYKLISMALIRYLNKEYGLNKLKEMKVRKKK